MPGYIFIKRGLLIAAALLVLIVALPSIKNKREEAFQEEKASGEFQAD